MYYNISNYYDNPYDMYYNAADYHYNPFYDPYLDEYHEVGYLRRVDNVDDINSVLVLYGKYIREGVYRYYTEYEKHGKTFRMYVSKSTMNKDTSRELYGGDVVYLDKPLDAKYEFDDQCFD
jgi:hypothetical protein